MKMFTAVVNRPDLRVYGTVVEPRKHGWHDVEPVERPPSSRVRSANSLAKRGGQGCDIHFYSGTGKMAKEA